MAKGANTDAQREVSDSVGSNIGHFLFEKFWVQETWSAYCKYTLVDQSKTPSSRNMRLPASYCAEQKISEWSLRIIKDVV